jgi:hypothetical protein
MTAALVITCPNCRQRHPLIAVELARIDRCLKCGHPLELQPGEDASVSDPTSLLQLGRSERRSLQGEHAPGYRARSIELQDVAAESATCGDERNFDNVQDRGLDRREPAAESLFQSLAQARAGLCSSLTELDRLRLFADAAAQGVVLPVKGPEHTLEDSGSQPAYHEDHLPGEEGSGYEDEAIVQGLMALHDELDRLRRELLDAQSKLTAARNSDARINELEGSLSISRQECETLRAELQVRVQEQEERSYHAANLVPERAAIEHPETVTEQINHLPPDRRQATGGLPAEADPQLESLTVQLHECRLANQRLRSLLKVFGMVRNLDQPDRERY